MNGKDFYATLKDVREEIRRLCSFIADNPELLATLDADEAYFVGEVSRAWWVVECN